MTAEAPYLHGTFCWVDLATADPMGAQAFYGSLFGWTFRRAAGPAGSAYTDARLGDSTVAGIFGAASARQEPAGFSCWRSYIAVDDVDRTIAELAANGGRVLTEPADIPETGRFAVGADPQGAVFCLWKRHSRRAGWERLGLRPSIPCWIELGTHDTAAAAAFYCRLFRWQTRETPAGAYAYVEFVRDGAPIAGMLPLAAVGAGDVPPHWLVYFCVQDCDATVQVAAAAGGSIIRAPFEVRDVGRIAILRDPCGATFAVIALSAVD